MKNRFLRTIPVLLLPIMLLSSCRNSTSRISAMEAGVFTGQDTTGMYECTFVVEKITDAEYVKAKEVNVLRETLKGGYYKVAFSAIGNDRRIDYDFVSLVDPFNGSPYAPESYRDANDSWISPKGPSSPTKHTYYGLDIKYDDKEDRLAAILEWVDPSSNA